MKKTKKEAAIKFMEELDIYKPYIEEFKENGRVCLFENYGGYYLSSDSELYKKYTALESKYNCLVYAVTREYTQIGEMFSFLIVTNYSSEWKTLLTGSKPEHIAFAYVWNKSDDILSEFGSIGLHSFGGGIKRIF